MTGLSDRATGWDPGLKTAHHGARSEARKEMERETGFEPATSTLARSHSTTELFPLAGTTYRTTRLGRLQPTVALGSGSVCCDGPSEDARLGSPNAWPARPTGTT